MGVITHKEISSGYWMINPLPPQGTVGRFTASVDRAVWEQLNPHGDTRKCLSNVDGLLIAWDMGREPSSLKSFPLILCSNVELIRIY